MGTITHLLARAANAFGSPSPSRKEERAGERRLLLTGIFNPKGIAQHVRVARNELPWVK